MYVDKYTNTEFEEQINEWSDMIHKDYKNVYVDLGKASG
jgi:glycine cleavage system protein P-like pyridoxal-binding family